MTKLNFDDGEAYTFLDELVRKKLDERFYTVKLNLDLRKESKTTKRNDTQTFISFKSPDCKKKGNPAMDTLKFTTNSTIAKIQ